jgi:hypothetical protein
VCSWPRLYCVLYRPKRGAPNVNRVCAVQDGWHQRARAHTNQPRPRSHQKLLASWSLSVPVSERSSINSSRNAARAKRLINNTCANEGLPTCRVSSRSILVRNRPSRDLPSTRSPNTPRRRTRDSLLSALSLRGGSTAFMQQWSRETSDAASPILWLCLRYALSGIVIARAIDETHKPCSGDRADATQRRSPVAGLSGGGGK